MWRGSSFRVWEGPQPRKGQEGWILGELEPAHKTQQNHKSLNMHRLMIH